MSPSSQRRTWGREGLWAYSILVVLGDGKTGEVSEVEAILMPYGHVHDAAHHRCCCGRSHVSLLGVSGMTSLSSSNKAARATRAKQEMYSMYLHVQQSGSVFIAAGDQCVYRHACLHVRVQCNTRLTKASNLRPYGPWYHARLRAEWDLYRRVRAYHTFPCNTFAVHSPSVVTFLYACFQGQSLSVY
jgi:hypothetical protein